MLLSRVRAHATHYPDRTALIAGQDRLTYCELDDRVSELSSRLFDVGVRPSALVGIHLDRGADVIVALLAILNIGAAYLIVEPAEDTAEGIKRLVLSAPGLVLARSQDREQLASRGLQTLTSAPSDGTNAWVEPTEMAAGDLAYIALTSGSTGVPKGVMVSHGNIQHYAEAMLERLGIREPFAYAHVTTLAADLGNTALFLALWTGGTIHLIDDTTRRDPGRMLQYLNDERVEVLKTTPSHWSAIFRAFNSKPETSPKLRFLLLGGEALGLPLAKRTLASGVTQTLVNHYGPTETTVGVAANVLQAAADLEGLGSGSSVPIGTPLGKTRLVIRTVDDQWRERDAVGELYISGPSVSLGYRGDPAATKAAFPTDVPSLGRAYRTGDRVRADERGVIEFLGRSDRQVKIDGYRVELAYVDAVLLHLPGVSDAYVVQLSGDRPILIAAVTLSDSVTLVELREQLGRELPSHMRPDRIELFDSLPRTANRKIDADTLRDLLGRRAVGWSRLAPETNDPVRADIIGAWRRYLGHSDFGVHDKFDMVGGSSLDAIQVVGELQAKGYALSATTFLAEPSIAALADRIRTGQVRGELEPEVATQPTDDSALSPSQQWFFRQRFRQPNYWNQALLLSVDAGVSSAELTAAIDEVVGLHPLLHTAFHDEPNKIRRVVVDMNRTVTESELPGEEAAIERHIQQVGAALQAQFELTRGTVFKAHLFRGDCRVELLLVAHHLCIDAVSWQIVINDISRCYSRRLRGEQPGAGAPRTEFGAWATFIRNHAELLKADLAHWNEVSDLPAAPDQEENCEQDAQAIWFRLSRAETEALRQSGSALLPRAAVVGAVGTALADQQAVNSVLVDVETHGRAALDEAPEVSRTVGWFTSTFPIRIGVGGDIAETIVAVDETLANVPHMGIAYGLHCRPRLADLCVNYLGSLALPHGDDLRAEPSAYPLGSYRGPLNDRVYPLKLTARLHDGQLVADLSYTPSSSDSGRMLELATATRNYLLESVGLPASEGQFVVEHGSTTGLLAQVPRALRCEPAQTDIRNYSTVLLTGATGFLGAHLLHLLLTRTKAKVYCLVRAVGHQSATSRLRDAYEWYLPGAKLDQWGARVVVLVGDVTGFNLGLTAGKYSQLGEEIDAIYHLAADTRLFGGRDSFVQQNTTPVRTLIGLADSCRPKDLHHVSTLAVCGVRPAGEPMVFSEDSLDIGQRFLNEYERSKYAAEQLVREFAAHGGAGFVYRPGNVTGHSISGRFQRNGGDSRLVQTLGASVTLGRVPKAGVRAVVLTPVDVVAEGIFAISRHARVQGGTFHVETPHQIPYEQLFAAMREVGYTIVEDQAADFTSLFGRYLGEHGVDGKLALAQFWASRPDRNVSYDHTRTRRLLLRLGVVFPELDQSWLYRYVAGLAEQNALPAPTVTRYPT